MFLPKPIIRFLVLTPLSFISLDVGQRLLDFYPGLFRPCANSIFSSFGGDRIVKFEAFDDPNRQFDSKMLVGTKSLGYKSRMPFESIRQGYLPTALFLALVLATPLPWRRKWLGLLIGLLLVHLFIVLRVFFPVVEGFTRLLVGDKPVLDLPPFWNACVRRGAHLISADLITAYLIPVLIWAALLLNVRDASRMLQPEAAKADKADEPEPSGESERPRKKKKPKRK